MLLLRAAMVRSLRSAVEARSRSAMRCLTRERRLLS